MSLRDLPHSRLFSPLKINDKVTVQHRVAFPPLTRMRATKDYVPSDLMLQYYDDRSREPGTLLVTEATFVSEKAGGYGNVPGIWNERQVQAWHKITDRVHANGSFISIQLWNLGRQANVKYLTSHGIPFKSSSDGVYLTESSARDAKKLNNPLTALTREEIKDYARIYGEVAENAVRAGFDFIEVHAANGYIFDQFFQQTVNHRTDEYGGSIENRARFFFEVVDEIISRVGSEKLSARVSPWATYAGMPGYKAPISPIATFGYIISELQRRADQNNGKIGYLSLVEPRVSTSIFNEKIDQSAPGNNDWVYEIWKGVVMRSGNYLKDVPALLRDVDNRHDRTLIAVGRQFIANPDLVYRLKNNLELALYSRAIFYMSNDYGYNTYPRYGEKSRKTKEEAQKRTPKALVPEPTSKL